ncbi:MAG: ribosome biogenesis GTPase Der [Bacteroidales bacterium]|nr:ribosome biogenesis GTPase Der [Bacteroidales bacterium]MCF8333259.1 ribosome biogenesis GTPase Der [Bacteroidales bacterium]
MGNIVAIIGRPNVGKSTLFNRLVGKRDAIVDATSGVTRDRHYGTSDWNGVEFTVIDTGGFVEGAEDVFEEAIRKQAKLAVDEADVILFMVDTKDGLTGYDQDVANIIRKSEKKVFLVANKADNTTLYNSASEFYSLGMGPVYPLSAINGSGTGDLLDEVVHVLDQNQQAIGDKPQVPRLAIVGRPNVGKSSFINTILGDERNIVTPIGGTTRDTVDTRYQAYGFDFVLVDTAGLRKKSSVKENVEFYSVMRAVRAIEDSDVCLLMIDATLGLESQELNILNLIHKNHKAVVLVVNKWDLISKETQTAEEYKKHIKARLQPFSDIPIVFSSVITKQRIYKTLEIASEVYKAKYIRIPTHKLNDILLPVIKKNPPAVTTRGRYIRIKYVMQLKKDYPMFIFFCNYPKEIKVEYKRFLENKIRAKFNLTGVPIEIYFRAK